MADLIGPELADLQELDFDLSLTGFDHDEIASLLADGDDVAADAEVAPEEPDDPRLGFLKLRPQGIP